MLHSVAAVLCTVMLSTKMQCFTWCQPLFCFPSFIFVFITIVYLNMFIMLSLNSAIDIQKTHMLRITNKKEECSIILESGLGSWGVDLFLSDWTLDAWTSIRY